MQASATSVVARWLRIASLSKAKQLLQEYVISPTMTNKAELSDWAINTFRDEAAKLQYDHEDQRTIFSTELERVRGLRPNVEGLMRYVKMSRAGASYRMNRKMRVALFCQLVAKGVLH